MQLEVDSVYKTYGDRVILSDVYLSCTPGEIVAVMGRNGSGKSTLFQIMYGTLKCECSSVLINHKSITGKAYKTGSIVYLPQVSFLPLQFTVWQIIKIMVGKKSELADDPLIKRILFQKIRELSGGETRYLEIRLMLMSKAPFVILDEPYRGLAPVVIERINQYIREASKTKGIIVSDHDYRSISKVATKILLLDDGWLHIPDADDLRKAGYPVTLASFDGHATR